MTLESSGQWAQDFPLWGECEGFRDRLIVEDGIDISRQVPCRFTGDVDGRFDPEISRTEVAWTCPDCGTEQVERK